MHPTLKQRSSAQHARILILTPTYLGRADIISNNVSDNLDPERAGKRGTFQKPKDDAARARPNLVAHTKRTVDGSSSRPRPAALTLRVSDSGDC